GASADLPEQPIYRNVWSYAREFGHAKTAAMIVPRGLVVEAGPGPEVAGPPAPTGGRSGAAPGRLLRDYRSTMGNEFKPVSKVFGTALSNKLIAENDARASRGMGPAIDLMELLVPGYEPKPNAKPPVDSRRDFHPDRRLKRQFDQLVDHTQ